MLRKLGRAALAVVATVALGLGMTSCGGGTIGYMWVLGTKYNQIAGFKIDDYTGNLTATVGSPYSSGGSNPTMIVVKSGGRYVYVLNSGTSSIVPDPNSTNYTISNNSANISVFSVGGDGTLTFQEAFSSQGFDPTYITTDLSGSNLFVLDAVSPDSIKAGCLTGSPQSINNCFGDITVFSLNSDTGRPTLIQNQQQKTPAGAQLTYFNVGKAPTLMKVANTNCLYTLDSGDQTLFPYTIATSSSQLQLPVSGTIATGASRMTYLGGNGTYMYITDAGTNQILPFSFGSNCALNTVTGGAVANLALTANPVYSFTDAKGKYLYTLNQTSTNPNNPTSSISAFVIQNNGQLQGIAGAPFSVGAGPVCMVEDPTNQYVYSSNSLDGTVTGKLINQNTGELSQLTRGSNFVAFSAGGSACLALSGSI
jgi:6-phosphogluconolactonase (cycloisomerase 2 family)